MSGIVDKRLPGRAFEDKERGTGRDPVGAGPISRARHPAPGALVPGAVIFTNMAFTASSVNGGSGAVPVLNGNPSRVYLLIQNIGGSDVYVSFGQPSGGVKLVAVSGSYELDTVVPTNAVFIYTLAGTSNCVLIQGMR